MSDPTVEHASGRDAIFISYRRGDTAYPAGWLYHQLVAHFGVDQVFKDVDSIELGSDFVAEITTAVSACHCLLALIGRDWLTAVDQRGRRRLDDPADFVRIEIEAALARGVRVVPVLVEDATMPYADELPPTLAPITRRQALVLSPTRFTADIEKLIGVLERTFAEAAAAREAELAAAREAELAAAKPAPPPEAELAPAPKPVPLEAEPPLAPPTSAGDAAGMIAAATKTAPPPAPVHPTSALRAPADQDRDEATSVPPVAPERPGAAQVAQVAQEEVAEPAPTDPVAPTEPPGRAARWVRGMIASTVVYLVALFLPWSKDFISTRDGFGSALLIVSWILLLAAAAWVLVPGLGASIRLPFRPGLVPLGLAGLALVCTGFVLAQVLWTATPDIGGLGFGPTTPQNAQVGAFLGLLAAMAATVLVGLLLRQRALASSAVARRVPTAYPLGVALLAVVAATGVVTQPLSTLDVPAPFEGDRMWWSFYGNFLGTTLETTDPFNINGATDVYVNAQISYEGEEDFDYLLGEVSTDGESWTVLNGTVNGAAIWSDGDEVQGIDDVAPDADENGEFDWVPLIYDLTAWAGESQVWFRFRYVTDHSYVANGFFIDAVTIIGDGAELLDGSAEGSADGSWTADGFVKAP